MEGWGGESGPERVDGRKEDISQDFLAPFLIRPFPALSPRVFFFFFSSHDEAEAELRQDSR